MTKTKFVQSKIMFAQYFVYILGILNLILAGIAIFCVVYAQDHPEHFSLVYIAVSIFMFYMGTIQTLPLILSSYKSQHTSSLILKKFQNTSNEFITTTTCSTFLPKYQQTLTTLNKNYQSFAFITNDHHRHSS
ncbi:unnamed protein product [Rotaria sordida]|uniref:Uncharacterized protein n=1 Tax=Rotaria sordida TaxID=392033 RepID=A0A818V5P5_9BILA|nr:unnamed protein product [Rotaria sordida]